jgi:ATP-binding cassette subfamily B protein
MVVESREVFVTDAQLIIGISRRIEYDLRNAYFQHLQKLSQSFSHRHKTGGPHALASNDLEAIRSMLGPA